MKTRAEVDLIHLRMAKRRATSSPVSDSAIISPEPEPVVVQQKKRVTKKRVIQYGNIEGVRVGATFSFRKDVSQAGIHTPIRAGICGGPDGALSVVLSGGYRDDMDNGDTFTYTGAGGRDAITERIVKDQNLDERYNRSLVLSHKTGNPVRVVRGAGLNSQFAPWHGYRFDGLYRVVGVKKTTGKDGHVVCSFEFQRLPNQPGIPRRTSV